MIHRTSSCSSYRKWRRVAVPSTPPQYHKGVGAYSVRGQYYKPSTWQDRGRKYIIETEIVGH
eukprot:2733564-Rhodomonas_salina.2